VGDWGIGNAEANNSIQDDLKFRCKKEDVVDQVDLIAKE
jgi:hypothetical protein